MNLQTQHDLAVASRARTASASRPKWKGGRSHRNNPPFLLIEAGARVLGLNSSGSASWPAAAGVSIGAGAIAAGILLPTLNQFRRQ